MMLTHETTAPMMTDVVVECICVCVCVWCLFLVRRCAERRALVGRLLFSRAFEYSIGVV